MKVINYTTLTAALVSTTAINLLRNFCKVTIKPLLALPCLSASVSVCMYQLSSHWTNFSQRDLDTSKKICQETPNLIKISQNISCTLHVELSVLRSAGSDICSATTQKMHVGASMAKWQRFQYLLHCRQRNMYNSTKGTHCRVSVATMVVQRHHNVTSTLATLFLTN